MTVSENNPCKPFRDLSLSELEKVYQTKTAHLTSLQIKEVENENMDMIRLFPMMGAAYEIYCALEEKRKAQTDAAKVFRLL